MCALCFIGFSSVALSVDRFQPCKGRSWPFFRSVASQAQATAPWVRRSLPRNVPARDATERPKYSDQGRGGLCGLLHCVFCPAVVALGPRKTGHLQPISPLRPGPLSRRRRDWRCLLELRHSGATQIPAPCARNGDSAAEPRSPSGRFCASKPSSDALRDPARASANRSAGTMTSATRDANVGRIGLLRRFRTRSGRRPLERSPSPSMPRRDTAERAQPALAAVVRR